MIKYIVEVYSDVTYWKNENGQFHRLGGLPAIERANGSKYYYENDKLHRLGGLPAIEFADGSKEYWENGKELTEAEAKRQVPAGPCDGKTITIEGKEYILTLKA